MCSQLPKYVTGLTARLQDSGKISIGEWLKAFDDIDTNDGVTAPDATCAIWYGAVDGVISRDEWQTCFGRESFKFWDADGNGTLDVKEWNKIYSSRNIPSRVSNAAAGVTPRNPFNKGTSARSSRRNSQNIGHH